MLKHSNKQTHIRKIIIWNLHLWYKSFKPNSRCISDSISYKANVPGYVSFQWLLHHPEKFMILLSNNGFNYNWILIALYLGNTVIIFIWVSPILEVRIVLIVVKTYLTRKLCTNRKHENIQPWASLGFYFLFGAPPWLFSKLGFCQL